MVRAKVFLYAKPFEGLLTSENFELIEEDLPPLEDGEFLAEALYISVDPYQRVYPAFLKTGETMIGGQVAKVIESKSEKFPVGTHVVASFGWRTHTISHEDPPRTDSFKPPPVAIPYEADEFPLSLFVGVLGMPGATANIGLLQICKPKPGETVVVTGAAGAVGSLVGQIAKIKECKAIGIAGTEEKCEWLKEIGFDYAINYKTEDVGQALREAAPNGVDCFFDNVGGEIASTIINQMNRFGKIAACGVISSYLDGEVPKVTTFLRDVVFRELELKGFLVFSYDDKTALAENAEWIREGKLKYKETITEGFENIIDALNGVLTGENIGKAVVKV